MKVVAGIIGMGGHIGLAHIKHLVKMPNVEIVRFFDPSDNPNLAHFPGEYALPWRSTVDEILDDDRINTVFIGSPDEFHAQQLAACVEAGKHVFCEKPMITSTHEVEDFQRILQLADENNLVISTCHPRRFDPPVVWLKSELQKEGLSERLGEITDFHFDFWYHEVLDEWKKDRSLLLDHFGHEIDLYRFLFGDDQEWLATKDFDEYDAYRVTGRGKGGAPNFVFTGHRLLKEQVYLETITIKGEKDAMVLQLNSGSGFFMSSGERFEFPKMDYDKRFYEVNKNFVEAITSGAEIYVTNSDMVVNNVSGVKLALTGKCNYKSVVTLEDL